MMPNPMANPQKANPDLDPLRPCRKRYHAKICGSLLVASFAAVCFAGTAIAAEPRVGEFNASATVVEIAGEEWARGIAGIIAPESRIEWVVNVPENYTPESPAGVVVYISPSNSGEMPHQWKSVLEEHNLIWVSANDSGNKIDPRVRITHSLLAPALVDRDYNIDVGRVYIAGLSGGGRVASIVAPEYSALFRGAIYICGVNKVQKKFAKQLAASDTHRFVFLTGEDDFNRDEVKDTHSAYRRAGIENSLYLEVRNMAHDNPGARDFAKAIAYLDGQ